jgi:hypothetical protein
MTTPSEYVLEAFREGADSTLYRGRQRGSSIPVLAVVIASEQSPQSLRRLEHEYSLAAELVPRGQLGLWRSLVKPGPLRIA